MEKIIIQVIIVFQEQDVRLKAVLISVVLICYFLMTIHSNPYMKGFFN